MLVVTLWYGIIPFAFLWSIIYTDFEMAERFYRVDAYETVEGIVTRVDPEYRYLTIVKTKIPFDDIVDVSGAEVVESE